MNKYKYIYLCFLVLACCATTIHAQQSVFKHWEGVTDRPLLANPYGQMMQQVHEYEYTYYVEPGKAVDLLLPLKDIQRTVHGRIAQTSQRATSDGTTIRQT